MKVIHAVPNGIHAFEARSLETGERALILTTPEKTKKVEK